MPAFIFVQNNSYNYDNIRGDYDVLGTESLNSILKGWVETLFSLYFVFENNPKEK